MATATDAGCPESGKSRGGVVGAAGGGEAFLRAWRGRVPGSGRWSAGVVYVFVCPGLRAARRVAWYRVVQRLVVIQRDLVTAQHHRSVDFARDLVASGVRRCRSEWRVGVETRGVAVARRVGSRPCQRRVRVETGRAALGRRGRPGARQRGVGIHTRWDRGPRATYVCIRDICFVCRATGCCFG